MLVQRRRTCFRTIAISSRDSDACVCTSACVLVRQRATASSSSREHETAKRGANAACRRPFAAPSQRVRMATLSSIERRVVFLQPRRHLRRRSPSCTCRSSRAARSRPPPRTPHRCRAPSPSSAPTVVPLRSSSVVASRAAARSDRGRVRRFHRPDARAAASPSAADRPRSRETASGTDGCASGSSRAARSRRARRSTRSCGRRWPARSRRCGRRGSTRRRRRRRGGRSSSGRGRRGSAATTLSDVGLQTFRLRRTSRLPTS